MQGALIQVSTWLAAQAPDAPAGEPGGVGALSPMLMIVLMFAVVYFLMIRPQSKQQKEHQDFLAKIQKGAEVVTSGGIMGRIHSISPDTVTLEIAKDVRIQVLKNYVYPQRPAAPAKDAKDSKDSKEEPKK